VHEFGGGPSFSRSHAVQKLLGPTYGAANYSGLVQPRQWQSILKIAGIFNTNRGSCQYNNSSMKPIYLDFNSTAPLLPEVANAMAQADAEDYANPASQHAEGRRARRVLEDARDEIARLLGANLTDRTADQLIFTSGGTEANNLALVGLSGARVIPVPFSRDPTGERASEASNTKPWGLSPARIVISAIEHPSIAAVGDFLVRQGWQIDRLATGQNGVVRLEHLDKLLAESSTAPPRLISVMLANNETGVLQPVAEIVQRYSNFAGGGVPVHTDAVQAVGKMPVNFRELGVAAMTVAPHKFVGPRGIGALVIRHGMNVQPILHGATQQSGIRPGTESVTLVLGFLAALQAWEKDRFDRPKRMAALRDRLETGIRAAHPSCVINGGDAPRLPHTSNVALVGHDRQALMMALDMAGVCCSTGSACASGSSEPSPVLVAMGLPKDIVNSSLRFSLGATTKAEEIDEVMRRISTILQQRK
jgi:cysteine desulfurase